MNSCARCTAALITLFSAILTGCGGEPIEEPPVEFNTLAECAAADWQFTEDNELTYIETNYVFHDDGTVELKKYVDLDEWQLWLNAGQTGNDVEIFPGVDLTLEQIGIILWLDNYTGYFYSEGTYQVDESAQQIAMTYPQAIAGHSRWGYSSAQSDFDSQSADAGEDISMTTVTETVTCEDNQLRFASYGNGTGNLDDPITGAQTHIEINTDSMIGRFVDYREPTPSHSVSYYELFPVDGGFTLNACSIPEEIDSTPLTIDTRSGAAYITQEAAPVLLPEADHDTAYSYYADDGFLYRRDTQTGSEEQLDALVQGYNGGVVFNDIVIQYAITEINSATGTYETQLRVTYKDGSDSHELTLPFYALPTGVYGSIALKQQNTMAEDRAFYFNPDTLEYHRIEPGRKGDYADYSYYALWLLGDFARIRYHLNPADGPATSVYTLMDLETGEELDHTPSGSDTYVADVQHNGELLYVSTFFDEATYTQTLNFESRAYGQAPVLLHSYSFSRTSLFEPSSGPFAAVYDDHSGVLYLRKAFGDRNTLMVDLNTFSTSTTPLYLHRNFGEWQLMADQLPGDWSTYTFPQEMALYVRSPMGNTTLLPKIEENRRTGYQIWKDTVFVTESIKWKGDIRLTSFSSGTETLKEYQLPQLLNLDWSNNYWPPLYSGDIRYQDKYYYFNTAADEFEALKYPDQSFLNEIQNVQPRDDNLFSADLVTFGQNCSTNPSGTLRQEGPAFWIEWNDGTTSRELITFTRQ
ncbi:hypothetical protein [uncultured Thalassolituus sp.]|uniref:hypothetical protein n=1 Tax=uncultured Thalassolituus sp. TaxID=285273 RepID=UPI002601E602|nr:hypothetical protein [uncultured Thalassolituus sp.]